MINGGQTQEYVSQQASLSVKVNGLYTVRGIEVSSFQSPLHEWHGAADHSVLIWSFDYLVEDRKLDSGRIVDGEKAMTPLKFSAYCFIHSKESEYS